MTESPIGAGRSGDERRLAERLLEQIRVADGLSGVALYLPVAGSLRRELVVGEDRFPTVWSAVRDGQSTCELEDGLLVGAGGEIELDPGQQLSAALAVRGLWLRRRLRDREFAVDYHGVELQALYDVGLAIASTLDTGDLGEQILMHAMALLDARRGALYLRHGEELRLEEALAGSARAVVTSDDPQLRAVLAGEEPPDQDLVPGARHLCGVGIGEDEEPRGLLLVADKESRSGVGPFGDGDRQTLALLANQAAIALETAELHEHSLAKRALERELELAAEIQHRLLPESIPERRGWEIFGWSRPARRVGGDWYDLLELPRDRVGLVLGDVSGKGMPAAITVSTLHAGLRLLAGREPITEVVRRCNQYLLVASASNRFATLMLGVLDPGEGRFDFLNAGHDPGIVVRHDGSTEQLRSAGLPLGIMREASWAEESIRMGPDELLCLYTDGFTEATSPEDEEFGRERLIEVLREHRRLPLVALAERLEAAVSGFAADVPQVDDQTLVLVRRSG